MPYSLNRGFVDRVPSSFAAHARSNIIPGSILVYAGLDNELNSSK